MDEQPSSTPPVLPAPDPVLEQAEKERQQRAQIIKFTIVGVVVLTIIIAAAVLLFSQRAEVTSQIRDVFIIFMALESLIIGAALIILIVQLAVLINLIQNEVKPILDATNETVNTLRGTTQFLSNNLVEPVIKLNEYLASLKKLLDVFRIKP